jgi:hypothetical protein
MGGRLARTSTRPIVTLIVGSGVDCWDATIGLGWWGTG